MQNLVRGWCWSIPVGLVLLSACGLQAEDLGSKTNIVRLEEKGLASSVTDEVFLRRARLNPTSRIRARKNLSFPNLAVQLDIAKIEMPDGEPVVIAEDKDGNPVDLDEVAAREWKARWSAQGNLDAPLLSWRRSAKSSDRAVVMLSSLPQPSELLGKTLVGPIEVGSADSAQLLRRISELSEITATKVRNLGGAVRETSFGSVLAEVGVEELSVLMKDSSVSRIELYHSVAGERLANYAFETTIGATSPLNGSWSNYPRIGVGIVEDQRPDPSHLGLLPPIASNGIFKPSQPTDLYDQHVTKAASVIARTTGGQLGIAPYEALAFANTGAFPNDIAVANALGWLIDPSMGGPGAGIASVSFVLLQSDTSYQSTCTQPILQHERMMDYLSGNFAFLAVAGAGNLNYGNCVVNRLRNGLVVGGVNDDANLSPYGSWQNPGSGLPNNTHGDWELPHISALAQVDTPLGGFGGTSAATPQVAGAASRVQSVIKQQSGSLALPQAVRAIIMAGAKPIATQLPFLNVGFDDKTGAGLLNVRTSEELASNRRLTQTTPSNPAPPSGHTEGYWSSSTSAKIFWFQRGVGNNLRVALAFNGTEECSTPYQGLWQCVTNPAAPLSMDLDLAVFDSQNNSITCGGGGTQFSSSWDNAYEYVDCRGMTGLAPGPLFLKVTKYASTVSSMAFGLAWRQF